MLLESALLLSLAAKPLMRDFIGLNTHTVQFKPDLYRPIAHLIRNYHPVEWDLGAELGDPNLPKTHNGVDWHQLYGGWSKDGYRTLSSLMYESIDPAKWQGKASKARAYGEAFARSLGPSSEHPYIETVEIGNEPQKVSEAQNREIFENMAQGLRTGDPKLKIATCAVAVGKEDPYSKDIETYRGLEKYIDVLNVHTYAFVEGWPTWRRSYPEDPKINYLKQVQKVIDWRNQNAKGRQVWVTEFGYDSSTKPAPTTGDFSKWVGVNDTEQAQYIVRSYLVFAGMDVDRAYLYWFNDDDLPQLHASSGITRGYKPKPSFFALAHFNKTLGNTRFVRAIRQDSRAYIYEFRGSKDRIWVAWTPNDAKSDTTVQLPRPPGRILRAERMPLAEGNAPKVTWKVGKDGSIDVPLGAAPTYFWIKRDAKPEHLWCTIA